MDSADLQLQQIEHVCDRLYNATNEHERADAQRSVLALSENAEHIPLCRHVLDRSHSSFALHVAASALTRLVCAHWNGFAPSTRLEVGVARARSRVSRTRRATSPRAFFFAPPASPRARRARARARLFTAPPFRPLVSGARRCDTTR